MKKIMVLLTLSLISLGFWSKVLEPAGNINKDSHMELAEEYEPAKASAVSDDQKWQAVKNIPILMYHEIGNGPNNLFVSEQDFQQQMQYLYQKGFRTVTMSQAREILVNRKTGPGGQPMVITFDDGYSSLYHRAWPVLKEYGFVATAFIITDFVGRPRYLTWEQTRELNGYGVEIGSHTQTHPDLSTLKSESLKREIMGSKQTLEQQLKAPATSFCYPGGFYNRQTMEVVREAGYGVAVTTHGGIASVQDDLYQLSRIRVYRGMSMKAFVKSLEGQGQH